MSSLKDKTLSNVVWSFIQKFGSQGISIGTTVILARLLTPKDFGLIGMLTIFIAISQGLKGGGFKQALIQKKDTDDEDFSSVFYINLAVSIGLYAILFFGAPLIANFYDQPILVPLTRALCLVFVIDAFSYIQNAYLEKAMRFKILALTHVPSIIISAVVAIGMALTGFGVWSIVGQRLSQRLAYTIQIWIYSKWTPLWTFNCKKAKSLFSFGSRLMISSVLNTVYKNIYLIIIGKFFPVATLGYYQNANTLTRQPATTLSSAVKRVTFPVFSSIQDDDMRLKRGYRKSIQQVFFWLCPAMIFAAALAEPLFRLLLTEKWLPAVPFFRLLCAIGITGPLNSFNLDIVNVKGRSDLYLKLNIAKKVLASIGIVVTIPFGIWALVGFQGAFAFVRYFINSYYSGQFIDYPMKDQIKDLMPIALLSLGLGGGLYLFGQYAELLDVFTLLIGALGAGSVYWITVKKMHFEAYEDFEQILKSQAQRFSKRS